MKRVYFSILNIFVGVVSLGLVLGLEETRLSFAQTTDPSDTVTNASRNMLDINSQKGASDALCAQSNYADSVFCGSSMGGLSSVPSAQSGGNGQTAGTIKRISSQTFAADILRSEKNLTLLRESWKSQIFQYMATVGFTDNAAMGPMQAAMGFAQNNQLESHLSNIAMASQASLNPASAKLANDFIRNCVNSLTKNSNISPVAAEDTCRQGSYDPLPDMGKPISAAKPVTNTQLMASQFRYGKILPDGSKESTRSGSNTNAFLRSNSDQSESLLTRNASSLRVQNLSDYCTLTDGCCSLMDYLMPPCPEDTGTPGGLATDNPNCNKSNIELNKNTLKALIGECKACATNAPNNPDNTSGAILDTVFRCEPIACDMASKTELKNLAEYFGTKKDGSEIRPGDDVPASERKYTAKDCMNAEWLIRSWQMYMAVLHGRCEFYNNSVKFPINDGTGGAAGAVAAVTGKDVFDPTKDISEYWDTKNVKLEIYDLTKPLEANVKVKYPPYAALVRFSSGEDAPRPDAFAKTLWNTFDQACQSMPNSDKMSSLAFNTVVSAVGGLFGIKAKANNICYKKDISQAFINKKLYNCELFDDSTEALVNYVKLRNDAIAEALAAQASGSQDDIRNQTNHVTMQQAIGYSLVDMSLITSFYKTFTAATDSTKFFFQFPQAQSPELKSIITTQLAAVFPEDTAQRLEKISKVWEQNMRRLSQKGIQTASGGNSRFKAASSGKDTGNVGGNSTF